MLRQRLLNGETLFGSWLQLPGGHQAGLIARQGFDWVAVDQEHGVFDLTQTSEAFTHIRAAGAAPVARVPAADPVWIRRTLDLGAEGIIVPMIETADMARAIVSAVRYPPLGTRGFGFCAANEFGGRFADYTTTANDHILLIAQIEHIRAVEVIDDILAVNGIDGALIGPYDLSGSMGLTGQVDHPDVLAAADRVRQACLRVGKIPGYHVVRSQAEAVRPYLAAGYRLVAAGMDSLYLRDTCARLVSDLRKLTKPTP